MEQTIVVLLDYELQQIKIFGECYKVIGFEDAFLLPYILDGNTALYITAADEVSDKELVSTVESLTTPNENPEPRYIHSTVEGYLNVDDINMVFAGPKDAKPLAKIGYDIFGKSDKLKQFLKNGKVEVVTESVAKSYRKPLPGKNLRDAALDSIILNKPADQFLANQDNIFDDNQLDEVSSDIEVETEAESMIKKGFGRK